MVEYLPTMHKALVSGLCIENRKLTRETGDWSCGPAVVFELCPMHIQQIVQWVKALPPGLSI